MTSKGSSQRSAIVTGASGQDGFYLVGRLLAEGIAVHAAVLDPTSATDLEALPGASTGLTVQALDITDRRACTDLVARLRPTELYNLAGRTSVAESFNDATRTWEANATAVETLLEAVRHESPEQSVSTSRPRSTCSVPMQAQRSSMTRSLPSGPAVPTRSRRRRRTCSAMAIDAPSGSASPAGSLNHESRRHRHRS